MLSKIVEEEPTSDVSERVIEVDALVKLKFSNVVMKDLANAGSIARG